MNGINVLQTVISSKYCILLELVWVLFACSLNPYPFHFHWPTFRLSDVVVEKPYQFHLELLHNFRIKLREIWQKYNVYYIICKQGLRVIIYLTWLRVSRQYQEEICSCSTALHTRSWGQTSRLLSELDGCFISVILEKQNKSNREMMITNML